MRKGHEQQMLFFIKELYRRYVEDEVAAYGAEMAYYFLLSIFPFLIFVTTLIGFLPIPGESFLAYLKVLLPHESYQFIRDNLLQILSRRNLKLLSFGIISMLWAASSGMGAAVRGINRALCQKDTRPFWIAVPLSIFFTMLTAALIVIYFVFLIFGRQIGAYLVQSGLPGQFWQIWDFFRHIVALLMMIFVFTLLYRFSPCIKIRWLKALPGAVFTSAGWLAISWLFAWYVNHFWNLSLIYGSIGGIIGLMVWLFISAQLIIMGGEVNAMLIFKKHKANLKELNDREEK